MWILLSLACSDAVPHDSGHTEVCGLPGDTYTDGMSLDGATYNVALSASPGPPDKGDNVWTMTITEGGAPAAGLVVEVEPFMAEHGHGTNPATYAATEGEPGVYESEVMDLFMGGLWDMTVHAGDDSVTWQFCLEG